MTTQVALIHRALEPHTLERLIQEAQAKLSREGRRSTVFNGQKEIESSRRSSSQASGHKGWVFEEAAKALQAHPGAAPKNVQVLRGHYDFIQYGPNESFGEHRDFEAFRGAEVTTLTALLALSAPLKGGELIVRGEQGDVARCGYETGLLCVFPARLRHAAAPVELGTKLVLKFDVVATGPLSWLSDREGAATFLPQSCTADMGYLAARESFLALASAERAAPQAIPLGVAPDELAALVRYYSRNGAVRPEQIPALRVALDALLCGDAALTDKMLADCSTQGYARFPESGDAPRGALFFACSYRQGPADETPQAWIAVAPPSPHVWGGWLGGWGPGEGAWPPPPPATPPTPLWAHEKLLAHETGRYAQGRRGGEVGAPHVTRSPSTPPAPWTEVATKASRRRPASHAPPLLQPPAVLPVIAKKLAAALALAAPSAHVRQEYQEEEECNDGDSYRYSSYETVLLRRGHFRLHPTG